MSEIKVNKASPATGTAFTLGDSGDTFTVPSGATIVNSGTATGFGGGKMGQVVQTVNTETETHTTTTFTTIPDFTVAITPAATSSKILIIAYTAMGSSNGYTSSLQLFRDTTQIFMGDAASSRSRVSTSQFIDHARTMANATIVYLDSPSSTSEVEYSCKWFIQSGGTVYLNRAYTDTDSAEYSREASSITAIEVLA